MSADDLISTIYFDVKSLPVGKKETKVFTLNREVNCRAEAEHRLHSSKTCTVLPVASDHVQPVEDSI